jgi:hypothetical protein
MLINLLHEDEDGAYDGHFLLRSLCWAFCEIGWFERLLILHFMTFDAYRSEFIDSGFFLFQAWTGWLTTGSAHVRIPSHSFSALFFILLSGL